MEKILDADERRFSGFLVKTLRARLRRARQSDF
jgi:hypothetical protein